MTPEDFKIKVLQFKNKLFGLCLRMLASEDDAADAVQEVYLKLWSMQDKLNTIDNTEAYAMRMARNYCLDSLKAAKNQHVMIDRISTIDASYQATDYEVKDTAQLIKSLIMKLPEVQRTIIHLRDVEQYEMSEIESITGLNPNAIRVGLSRARRTIRDKMQKYYQHEYQRN